MPLTKISLIHKSCIRSHFSNLYTPLALTFSLERSAFPGNDCELELHRENQVDRPPGIVLNTAVLHTIILHTVVLHTVFLHTMALDTTVLL